MIAVFVNGQPLETSAPHAEALALELSPAPASLLIEINGRALTRSEWASTTLHENDRIEVLRVAAGG